MKTTIGFIGGGRITAIFLAAWKDGGVPLHEVVVSDPDAGILANLQRRFPEIQTTADNRLSAGREVVFMALHPPVAKTVLPQLADALAPKAILVSLAPVLTFEKLAGLLGGFSRLSRMIPNAPSMIHRGFNPCAFGNELSGEDRRLLERLYCPLGEAPEVAEPKLEAYAILAAMGPTYFWFQWQTLRELAGEFGLGQAEADTAIRAMLEGSVRTFFDSGLAAAQVIDLVPVKPLAEAEPQIAQAY